VSTSQQTGDGDVMPHQPSYETSQQGAEVQCHVGNDAYDWYHHDWYLKTAFKYSLKFGYLNSI